MSAQESISESISLCSETDQEALASLLARYGLDIEWVDPTQPLPGSFWGAPEAGLIGNTLYLRGDTPVHSALHEACHYVCMSPARRNGLHTDAGGGYDEENAVCYLQILLADALPAMGAKRLMADMDAWGYSFRLGSTRAWFEGDAEDARQWLTAQGMIDERQRPTWRLRQSDDPLPSGVTHGV
jgi:hypothetical protein